MNDNGSQQFLKDIKLIKIDFEKVKAYLTKVNILH